MEVSFSIVCLSPQDWGVALPTNRQQIMLRAARRGHVVVFVETGHFIGKHLWRLVRGPNRRSLVRRLVSAEEASPGIWVKKGLNLLPRGNKYRQANALNNRVTAWALARFAARLPAPRVLWIYNPCSAGVAERCGESFAVYDCVDDYPEQAGGDKRRRALATAGDELAAKLSRLVFATTSTLYQRHQRINPRTHLVPNVGDFGHFSSAADRKVLAPELRSLRRPILGFSGNLVPSKVDFALLHDLAEGRPEWTLLLIGPSSPASAEELARLCRLPNVSLLGQKPYAELPRYVAAFDVGLIPYTTNAYTRSCFPLKLYEYLAAGKPVVASGLPELAGREPDVVLADGVEAFGSAVAKALELTTAEDRERRQVLASQNTWETRAGRLLDLVADELRS